MNKVIAIDASIAGVSGDMMAAALLNLIENPSEILKRLSEAFSEVFDFDVKLGIEERSHAFLPGYHLTISQDRRMETAEIREKISKSMTRLSVNGIYESIGSTAFDLLIDAETKVHGTDKIELHEIGSSDTVVDLVTICYLLQYLDIASYQLSPVELGSGTVKTHHGLLPVPVPVVSNLISTANIITKSDGLIGEATTPTGISIIIAITEFMNPEINVNWSSHGTGWGSKKWPDRANALRLRIGTIETTAGRIALLETNLDDISGEHLGLAMEKLMKQTLDVSYYPLFMKKNRPGYCLRVICRIEDIETISEEIMRLTGSLGVRVSVLERHIGSRDIRTKQVNIDGNSFDIRVKSGKYSQKIEFEDLKQISEKLHLSAKEVEDRIRDQIND